MALFQRKFNKQEVSSVFSVLDIGSVKVCCAIGQKKQGGEDEDSPGDIRILGLGQQASRGMRNGNIVDVYQLENSILNAVHTAEQSAGININKLFVGLPTNAIKVHIVQDKISVSGRPIDDHHLRKLLNSGRDYHLSPGQQIIHVFPVSYKLDNASKIVDPRGMVGDELSCMLCILSAPVTLIRNLSSCLERCHLDISGFVASGYAAGLSTLVKDELSLGATIIDIGGDSTTMTSFVEDKLVDTVSFPLGGQHITNDIARVLATPVVQAERLKNLYGTLIKISDNEHEMIVIPQLGEQNNRLQNNSVSKFYLAEIIRCRIEEIFRYIRVYIQKSKVDSIAYQRLVLTGGTSQLSGIRDFAGEYFDVQVRLGHPFKVLGGSDIVQTPIFSTAAGLLRFAIQEQENQLQISFMNKQETKFQKIISWIRENF
jgi:cell division protein FtsA